MKTKNLFLALTLPMAFAACSNEEFIENNAAPTKDNLVELGEGFALAVQGTNGASTRGIWESGDGKLSWSWLPTILASSTGANSTLGSVSPLNVNADEIGLCWTGELPDGTGSIGDIVYTNYQFLHNGWLAKGQEAAKFAECSPFALENGKVYGGITEGSLSSTSTLAQIKSQLKLAANQVKIDGVDTELDLNTGVFSTANKAIFGGSYIAYYPYNENFIDAASLPATSPVSYTGVTLSDVTASHVAKNTFMVGYAQNLIGGAQASKLGLNPLSAIISLQLKGATGVTDEVKKVALWSQDGFVTSVALNANKIKTSGAAAGEALYVEGSKKTTSIIVATLASNATLSATAQKIYLPVLPTTAKGLKVIVYDNNDKAAVVDLGKDYTFEAGKGTTIAVELGTNAFKSLIAVDEASLKAAVEGTYTAATNVTVIGDITLTTDVEVKNYVTVEGGKIIVPEDKTLTVDAGATIKSAIEVQGQTCCGSSTNEGKMVVKAKASIAGNVSVLAGYGDKKDGLLEFAHTAGEVSTVAATATIVADGGSIDFKGVTDIFGTLTLNAGMATLSATTSDVNVKGGTVNNNGTFEVKDGKFAMLDASGNTVASAGKNFKNNGTFIDNVGTTIGGATQYMTFGINGDYICKVNDQNRLNEAYQNKIACSTIQFINTSTVTYDLKNATKHNDKYINVVDNGTLTKITSTAADADANAITVTIGNLGVLATRTLVVDAAANPINVNGNIVLDGSFTTEADVQGMTASNLTVNKGGAATFENRTKLGVTLAVANTIEVKKGGSFTITPATTDVTADVTCKKLIEGGTFTGKPRVIE